MSHGDTGLVHTQCAEMLKTVWRVLTVEQSVSAERTRRRPLHFRWSPAHIRTVHINRNGMIRLEQSIWGGLGKHCRKTRSFDWNMIFAGNEKACWGRTWAFQSLMNSPKIWQGDVFILAFKDHAAWGLTSTVVCRIFLATVGFRRSRFSDLVLVILCEITMKCFWNSRINRGITWAPMSDYTMVMDCVLLTSSVSIIRTSAGAEDGLVQAKMFFICHLELLSVFLMSYRLVSFMFCRHR